MQEMERASDGRVARRVLFSVWDHSSEMYQERDDPRLVPAGERVEVLYAAPFVTINRFGGEGTGAQCIWDTSSEETSSDSCWSLNVPARMLIRCQKDDKSGKSTYAAYYAKYPQDSWRHLATFRVAGGKPFDHGFYSFIEDFKRDTRSISYEREAEFGPAGFSTTGSNTCWECACKSNFTASGADFERPDNIDSFPGGIPGTRVLCTGGDDFCGQDKLDAGLQDLHSADLTTLRLEDCPPLAFDVD